MKVFEANITHQVSDYLNENLKNIVTIEKANQKINLKSIVDGLRFSNYNGFFI